MIEPLALLLYEKLLPGTQLIHRLEDLGYRVQSVAEPAGLVPAAREAKPILVIADVEPRSQTVCNVIGDLQQDEGTAHIPVIAIVGERSNEAEELARRSGAKLVVTDTAILAHLDHFLNQALEL